MATPGLTAAATVTANPTPKAITKLCQFTWPIKVDNILPLENDHLLFTTSYTGNLYYIDPLAIYPSPQRILIIGGVTALTGLAKLDGDDLYAMNGGIFPPNSWEGHWKVTVIKVTTSGNVTASEVGSVGVVGSGKGGLYGLVALPKHGNIVLSADPSLGLIWRINTVDGSVDSAVKHPALGSGDDNPDALGVTGLRIRHHHLYFTNSAQKTFGRFPIDAYGSRTGDVEILARLPNQDGVASYGDFTFDHDGNAFVAVFPGSVYKITPNGTQTVVVGGNNVTLPANSTLLGPTSVIVANNGSELYVSTSGLESDYPALTGGQLMKVQLGDDSS